MLFIRPTEKNLQIARAAQIYYKKGAYAEKPEQKADQKPEVKPAEQQKPEAKAEQKKPEKPVEQKKPETKAEQQKPEAKAEQQKADQKPEVKPVEQKKPEAKAEQQKPVEPVVEVLDSEGNIVAMLPGVPEEAPRAARTTAAFDINNFVKPAEQKASTNSTKLNNVKSIDEVYTFIRNTGVSAPFDPMPGYSAAEKTRVLKGYANFNGTHPGMDILQLNTLIMVFNSPDLARKMINCGLDPKQTLGIKRFNEVPAKKYDNNNAYDFAFEYTLSKKKKLVLLVNSIPTYDEKQGWMSGYNISVK